MRMPNLRHVPFQVAALPLQIEVERRTEPNSLRHTERLLQNAFVERLNFAEALPEPRHGIRRKALGYEERRRGCSHHRPRPPPARHHKAEQADLVSIE